MSEARGEITRPAHAKINLTLDVGARRADGYHEIESVMQTLSLHDTLTVRHAPDRPGVRLTVGGAEADGVPADESNLVHRAAVRLQKVAAARGILPGGASGLDIALTKRIPSQAGLGGGSSDAAACLLAVDALLGLGLSRERLTEIGAALGADVPFFLTGGTALAQGLGERVSALPPLAPAWDGVIVRPPIGVPTAWAYGALDARPGRVTGAATAAWLAGGRRVGNDFEAVARSLPEVAAAWAFLRDAPERAPGTPPLLCGSGSALFCRTPDRDAAVRLAGRAAGVGRAWAVRTVEAAR